MVGINHKKVVTSQERGLAVDWNDDHEQTGDHDCEKHQHLNHVIENRTTWPAGPVEGQVVYRSDQHSFNVWNGTRWVSMVGPATIVVAADGSGDYTDIQDGIDALPVTGGVVYIKEGTYNIATKIVINVNNTAIIGAGRSTIIQTVNNIKMIECINPDNILIENLYLNGAGNGNGLNRGIQLSNSNNSIVRNCWVTDCGSTAILIIGGNDCLVMKNIVINNWSDGISLSGTCDRIIVSNNSSSNNSDYGISLATSGKYGLVIGNQCNGSTNQDGIYVYVTDEVIISGNHANDNEKAGIYIGDSDYCSINGNICNNNNQVGAFWGGVHIDDDANENTIIGNTCTGNDRGIYIFNANCDRNLISGNQCRGNITASITDNGTNTLPNGAVGTNNLQLDDLNIV